VVFDEKKRKEFLTGFKKRKDERRQKWKDKVDKDLKKEIQKIKDQTRTKMEKSAGNKSNEIVPEIAHLIDSAQATSTTTELETASVTVTTFDNLADIAAPWRKKAEESDEEEEESKSDEEDNSEEVPGMSLKPAATEKIVVGSKEKKAINRAAIQQLQKSKAFKAKEKIKAKKQRNANRFKKKTLSKREKHLRKTKGANRD